MKTSLLAPAPQGNKHRIVSTDTRTSSEVEKGPRAGVEVSRAYSGAPRSQTPPPGYLVTLRASR